VTGSWKGEQKYKRNALGGGEKWKKEEVEKERKRLLVGKKGRKGVVEWGDEKGVPSMEKRDFKRYKRGVFTEEGKKSNEEGHPKVNREENIPDKEELGRNFSTEKEGRRLNEVG